MTMIKPFARDLLLFLNIVGIDKDTHCLVLSRVVSCCLSICHPAGQPGPTSQYSHHGHMQSRNDPCTLCYDKGFMRDTDAYRGHPIWNNRLVSEAIRRTHRAMYPDTVWCFKWKNILASRLSDIQLLLCLPTPPIFYLFDRHIVYTYSNINMNMARHC